MVLGLGFTRTDSSDAQYPPQLHTASVAIAAVAVRSCSSAEGGPLHRQLESIPPCLVGGDEVVSKNEEI